PCRDALALTHKDDDFSFIPDSLGDLDDLIPQWDLQAYRNLFRGGHGETIEPGCEYLVESRDTITLAPELVRMTLNMAMTHTDADSSVYGKRLVYGGHTISMAAAQMTRALPNMVTILGWYSCDHLAPVFEEDTLQSTVNIDGKNETDNGCLVDISVRVVARRGRQSPDSGSEVDVLLWKLCGLFA
ncbi:MAG: MaoC/PaaZ C-terminal domain-containing protein, partial [Gammaproteobacteria bacterium]|nr:MaoC/PaaZ C-terminal domain-containing protein [Gammaproteobacteria bacterium]